MPISDTSGSVTWYGLVVGNLDYKRLDASVATTVPTLAGTANDVKSLTEKLYKSGVKHVDVLGATWQGSTVAAVPVESGEFLDRIDALARRVKATPGAQGVVAFAGLGAWDNTKGAMLAFADTYDSDLKGGVPTTMVGALLDDIVPDRIFEFLLDTAFTGTATAPKVTRTLTPTASVPSNAVRFRPSDYVLPPNPAEKCSEESTGSHHGTLTAAILAGTTAIEIDGGISGFRIFDIKPIDTDEIIGVFIATGSGFDDTANSPYKKSREYWRFNSGITPWPNAFRLVLRVNGTLPTVSNLASFEMYANTAFPAGVTSNTLPGSISEGKFYQLSKATTSNSSIALDAHLWRHSGTTTSLDWYAVEGALLSSTSRFLNLADGEWLVFAQTTSPSSPNPSAARALINSPRNQS